MEDPALERVREVALKILEFGAMELVHIEMKREPKGLLLRLFIDKEGGVTLDDCARVSRQLSAQMDVEDPIQERYTLEVSSPGLDRPLWSDRDYDRFRGHRIRLSTFGPVGGRRNFLGRLVGLCDGEVRLVLDEGNQIAIPRDQVAKARLEVEISAAGRTSGMKEPLS
jgi:ribosome maturation factor RimP